MLALVERFLGRIGRVENTDDVLGLLAEFSSSMGYRSAALIEYQPGLFDIVYILDTDRRRGDWWRQYAAAGMRDRVSEISALLESDHVIRMPPNRFEGSNDPRLAFLEERDLLEVDVVPISHDGQVLGVAMYIGSPELTQKHRLSLQMVSYGMFAQIRAMNSSGFHTPEVSLTPREKQVMELVAEGLTSADIAGQLSMSSRTVNQHIENVSRKLETRNRVQTAAEAVRRGLLG